MAGGTARLVDGPLGGIASAPPGPGAAAGTDGPVGIGRGGPDGAAGALGPLGGVAQSSTVVGAGVPPGPRAAPDAAEG
ncbi:hypothetical protein HHU10_21850, partial [Tsukamurella columbiensis]|nr:hypothetical protein [Tsukamurella columbiensis]